MFNFLKKFNAPKRNFKKTNIYFHNFRNKISPESFGTVSLYGKNKTIGGALSKVREVLKINDTVPLEAYDILNINKLEYSWLYDVQRNGYGPKRNFKLVELDSPLNTYENILVNYHHSQHNEDYIIDQIFKKIGTTNKYFVEFGAGDGQTISNVALLRYDGWKGLFIEPVNPYAPEVLQNKNITFSRDFLTPDTINSVFKKNNVPPVFDFLSIDIDSDDYYLWQALKDFRPRVLCIEVSGPAKDIKKLDPYEVKTDGPKSSIITMTELSRSKGYELVYNNRSNVFYVTNEDFKKFTPIESPQWNQPFVATVDLF